MYDCRMISGHVNRKFRVYYWTSECRRVKSFRSREEKGILLQRKNFLCMLMQLHFVLLPTSITLMGPFGPHIPKTLARSFWPAMRTYRNSHNICIPKYTAIVSTSCHRIWTFYLDTEVNEGLYISHFSKGKNTCI